MMMTSVLLTATPGSLPPAGTESLGSFPPGAPRYWPTFGGAREVRLLDGEWSFGFIDGWDSGFDSMDPNFMPARAITPNKTLVPSCMDVVAGGAPGYLGPRGVGMFRTNFSSPAANVPVRLQFQSCSFYCRVWVNGHEIGDHRAGGYVAFWLDVPQAQLASAGKANELFVIADNRFNHTTAPMHTGGDFWHYGGIIRSVELHTMATEPVLWRAYVLPSNSSTTDSVVGAPDSVNIELVLSAPESGPVAFSIAFDGGAASSMAGTAEAGRVVLKNIPVPNPLPWSPDSPNLHTVKVLCRGGSVTERFGLRRFGAEKASARLTLNGKVTRPTPHPEPPRWCPHHAECPPCFESGRTHPTTGRMH